MEIINQEVKKKYGSWAKFCRKNAEDPTNFKRKILRNLYKINCWIEPLGLTIKIIHKNENND